MAHVLGQPLLGSPQASKALKYEAPQPNDNQVPNRHEEADPENSLASKIKRTRNMLYDKPWFDTILFTHMLRPIAAHGSHLIYAPDQILGGILHQVRACDVSKWKPNLKADHILSRLKTNIRFGAFVVLFSSVVYAEHAQITCFVQNILFGWADFNQTLNPISRFGSISLLMCARLLISNVLPFTSPAFAYLIAKSQPPGQEGLGVFYLIACSIPAGLLVPILDWVAYEMYGKSVEKHDGGMVQNEGRYDNHFLCTALLSYITNLLPFSFWVQPLFMMPSFSAAKEMGDVDDMLAAAVAVLAGHFMIWSGPATTMHSRQFVPDLITCALIQPLGLFEDVAVVIATWAGASAQGQHSAEMGLFVLMIVMNVVRFSSTRRDIASEEKRAHVASHGVVLVLTLSVLCLRAHGIFWPFLDHDSVLTTTSTTTTPSLCATEHSNTKAMALTVGWVSALAVGFRMVARAVAWMVNDCSCMAQKRDLDETKLKQPLDEDLGI